MILIAAKIERPTTQVSFTGQLMQLQCHLCLIDAPSVQLVFDCVTSLDDEPDYVNGG